MGKLISGRVKKTPQTGITSDRYEYLGLDQAEPNLGDPLIGPSSIGAKPVPPGQQYILVSTGIAGDRYWIPNQGGIIPGSISIYNEDSAGPAPNGLVGGLSSTTQLIFIGNAVSAQGFLTNDGFPAPNVNITISPPGNNGSVLFKESNDFATSSNLVFNSSVGILTISKGLNVGSGGTILSVSSIGIGIGTTNATQELDVNGDLRLRGTIYDFNNQPGIVQQLLVKNSFGGLTWVNQSSIAAGAGGTFTNIQYHNSGGIVGGASNFVFDDINNRIGIGSTQPRVTFDVLGISSFIGGVTIDNLSVSGGSTFVGGIQGNLIGNINSPGISTFAGDVDFNGDIDVDGHTELDNVNVSGIATFAGAVDFNGDIDVDGHTELDNVNVSGIATFAGAVDFNGDIDVDGHTELDNLNVSENLYVVGLSTLNGASRINGTLRVFGNTTLSNTSITNLTSQQAIVTGLSTFAGITTVTGVTLFTRQLSVSGVSTFAGITTVTGPTLFTKQLNVSGVSTVSGSIFAADDETYDIGTNLKKFNVVYARLFFGQIIGNAETATSVIGGIANVNSLFVAGISTFNGHIRTQLNNTFDIGTPSNRFNNVYANAINGSSGIITNFNSTNGNITNLFSNSAEVDSLDVTDLSSNSGNFDTLLSLNILSESLTSGRLNVTGISTFRNIIPSADNTYDLGGTSNRWNTVYANSFIGAITGNADSATRLFNARNFSITGDVDAPAVSFDGTGNVNLITTLDNTGVVANTYGSSTTIPVFAVDAKGRITSVTNTSVNFSTATVLNADKLTTARNFSITGDLSWNVNFDGSANVTSVGTLANSGVVANTYGSSTTIPVFTVDTKGRITSVTNTGITGINAASVSAAGANTQVQFNDNGFFAGNSNFTFNKTTNVLSVPTLSGNVTGCTFSNDAVNKANITTRTDSGFYEHDTATTGEGWPITSNTWMHMIACTHSNDANYYSMQIAASFFNQTDLYYRSTNASGTTGWSKIWHSNNDGSGSGLDADLLDGLNASTSTSGSTIVARDGNGDDFRRYGFASYFNSTDDVSTGTISHIMAKFGDNYYRSATAAKVATFISGQSMNISGNATNLSTNRTNWSTNGTITAVVGQLAWKNFGNNHTIFDASQSTSPDGGAVNNTNSQVAWTATYPTLMGWNGANTFGVRVDSARLADNSGGIAGYSGTFWTSNNDGAGSGLDADLLDGINSTSFARVDSSSTFTVATYFQSNLGTTLGSLSSPPLQAYATGTNAAFMSFHREESFAVNFGLDSDNVLRIGGWSASANRWQLDMSGNMTVAGEVIANSDIKLKENIEVIPNALEKISQIRGVTFTRNDQEDKEKRHAGVIAQEVEKVFPEVVMEGNDGIKSVAYGNLVGLLIEAIKEQQEQINNLTDEINKLKK